MGSQSGLIGRAAALRELSGGLDDAAAGTGRMLVVIGDAGMGKSAALAVVSALAAERGFAVLHGQAVSGGGAPPLWPWTQVLRGMIADHPALDDWLAERLASPLAAEPGTAADDPTEWFRLGETMAAALERSASERPVLITLDDLQWADERTVALLAFLARRLGGAGVLLLGAARAEGSELVAVDGVETILLTGLDEDGVADLITRIQGSRPPIEVTREVTRRSGGNPFFVRELARIALMTGGWTHVEAGSAAVPAAITMIVRNRLSPLSAPCRELLDVAAVVGAVAEREVVGAVLDCSSAELDRRADEAVLARVLTREDGRLGWSFSHDLFRDVILADLEPARGRELHAEVGLVLARMPLGSERVSASRVAQHLTHGGDIVRDQARVYATAAAAEATRVFAHREAIRHLRHAVQLSAPEDQPELLLALADAYRRVGDRAAAERCLRQVTDSDPEASVLARAALGLAALEVRSGTSTDDNIALLEAANRALELSDTTTSVAMRSRVLSALARELVHADAAWLPDPRAAARRTARHAVDLAEKARDPGARAAALLAEHDVGWLPGTAGARLPIIGRLERSLDGADPDLLVEAVGLRAAALIEQGDPAGVRELSRFIDRAEQLGHAHGRWVARGRRATLAAIGGDVDAAERHARAALAWGQEIGVPDAYGCFGTTIVSLAAQGRPISVEAPPEDDPVAVLSPLILAVTAPEQDHRTGVRSVPVAMLPAAPDLEARAVAAIAYAGWGTDEQRRELYDALVEHAGSHVVVGGCAAYYGPVDHYLGLLAVALGQPDQARGHLAAAAAMARRLGASGWVERIEAVATRQRRDDASLVRIGPTWLLRYQDREAHLPDAKGLQDLAMLLAAPGSEIHVLTLLGRHDQPTGADPVLDAAAKRSYKRRLTELAETLAEADRVGDAAASERAAAEASAVRRELTAATALRGRDRHLGSEVERARKTVSARIRDALGRIDAVHPELADHLRSFVTLGTRCSYRPTEPIRWRLRPER